MIKALKFASINQLTRLISGPAVLFLIPFSLTPEQQGFWFAMTSLAAMTAFSDMGFSSVVFQCAAHEYARTTQCVTREGFDNSRKNRLTSLFVFSVRRILYISIIVFPIVLGTGFYLFSGKSQTVNWAAPWVLLTVVASLSLILNVMLSFFEGCDAVAVVQRIKALMAVVNLLVLGIGLVTEIGLWVIGLASLISTAVGAALLWGEHRTIASISWLTNDDEVAQWSKEITPLLLKYCISWGGGYVMFQLFTPIMFQTHGAIEAGQVGLTISLFTAIFSISNIWSTYQLPQFSIAVAQKKRAMLTRCFKTSFFRSTITFILLSLIMIVTYIILEGYPAIFNRFLSLNSLVVLAIAWLLQMVIHNLAIYLRAFREEPLSLPTAIAAVYTVVATIICGKYGSPGQFFLGFLTVYIWFIPVVYILFRDKKELTSFWND